MFGTDCPATGTARTTTDGGTTANWADFPGQVEGWTEPAAQRVVVDDLATHGATDVLLLVLAHRHVQHRSRVTQDKRLSQDETTLPESGAEPRRAWNPTRIVHGADPDRVPGGR